MSICVMQSSAVPVHVKVTSFRVFPPYQPVVTSPSTALVATQRLLRLVDVLEAATLPSFVTSTVVAPVQFTAASTSAPPSGVLASGVSPPSGSPPSAPLFPAWPAAPALPA